MHSFRRGGGSLGLVGRVCAAVWLLVGCGAGFAQELPAAPVPKTGVVIGSVVDPDGAEVDGARVVLTVEATRQVLQTVAEVDGTFRFAAVPAGAFAVAVSTERGLAPGKVTGMALPGQVVAVAPIVLQVASEMQEVNAMSPHDAAEIEVKVEESQRILGILPNYGVTYNWNAPPLDTKQKFELATRATISPFTFGLTAIITGVERATGNYNEFGAGATGYFYLYGATTADIAIGNELGGAVFPWMFRQDPRYFWKGTGSIKSRIWYAITRTVICRSDKGKDMFSYSGVLGNFGAGAMSNLYYPKVDRNGWDLTLENGALAIAGDAIGNLEQEFLFKWFTPGSRKKKPVDEDQ